MIGHERQREPVSLTPKIRNPLLGIGEKTGPDHG